MGVIPRFPSRLVYHPTGVLSINNWHLLCKSHGPGCFRDWLGIFPKFHPHNLCRWDNSSDGWIPLFESLIISHTIVSIKTLTAWIVTKYYWENASSVIASSREHLNGQENMGGAASQRHTVAWPAGSRGWCARGPRIETWGSHHIIAHSISRQIGFSGSGVRVNMPQLQELP